MNVGSLAPQYMKIALIGTRGVPAAYGGFETAVEEIGSRLAARGHSVVVYCRSKSGARRPTSYRGMRLVHLPALTYKAVETLSHTFLSAVHSRIMPRPDVAFVFNAANAPFVPLVRGRSVPVAVHVDGLEWKRAKWGGMGRRYYRSAERLSVRVADALIADAPGISTYYRATYDAPTELIAYGTKILRDPPADRLAELGLEPGAFHLVVARFEPENHVDVIVEGFVASAARLPLVVVGAAPYAAQHTARIRLLAQGDERIRLVGSIYDQELLDQLYGHAASYLHGHSVGGTNPSLLRAMGAGTAVIAWDVGFNREVVGDDAALFSTPSGVASAVESAEMDPLVTAARGARSQERASAVYDWDLVSTAYEELALRLVGGRRSPTRMNRPRRKAS